VRDLQKSFSISAAMLAIDEKMRSALLGAAKSPGEHVLPVAITPHGCGESHILLVYSSYGLVRSVNGSGAAV